MAATSALSLITRSLRVIGECAGEEVPDAAKAQDGFDHLQDLMDALKTQRLMIPVLLRTQTPLVIGKASYTIGPGGDIDIPWPQTIEWARLIQNTGVTPPIEVPLRILSDQEWVAVRQKTMVSSYAQSIYFNHGWTTFVGGSAVNLGTIYVLPIPQVPQSALALYTPQAFPEFADLATTYVFPPGWNRVLRLKLAKALASEYGRDFPSEDELAEAWADVKRVNTRPRELRSDYPDTYQRLLRYDIQSDT